MSPRLSKLEQRIIELLAASADGMTGEDIAEQSGSTPMSVKTAIHALRRLGHNIVMIRRPDLRGPNGGMAGVYQLVQVSI